MVEKLLTAGVLVKLVVVVVVLLQLEVMEHWTSNV
jgi:hypothetical protein